MKILIIGSKAQQEEAKEKFGSMHDYRHATGHNGAKKFTPDCHVVFDFTMGDNPEAGLFYQSPFSFIAFLDTTMVSLHRLGAVNFQGAAYGFCGLPGFLNRELLEVSVATGKSPDLLKEVCSALATGYKIVADCAGLVTPRVICMIINEAYCTVEEGTAIREDIDLAMKLGTNYPYGPFEWCRRIGIKNVYGLLESVYEDTKDERYKVNGLLEREYRESLSD